VLAKRESEPHLMASDDVVDVVTRMSDGLTVPFTIAAGISGSGRSALGIFLNASAPTNHRNISRAPTKFQPTPTQPGR
jgi:hypothetical protein